MSNGEKMSRSLWAGILLVLLVSFVPRLHDLDRESLFMDEIRQVGYYKAPYSQVIHHAASQQQPPLDYWIGHLLFKHYQTDFAARLPAALFGAFSVLLLFFLLRAICSVYVALFFSVLMGLLPFHIFYSQEARPYTIALFFLLAFLLALESVMLRKARGFVPLLLLTCVCTLFLYSRTLFPLCVFSVAFFLMLVSWFQASRKQEGYWSAAHASVICSLLLAFLIYLPVLLGILDAGQGYLDRETQHGVSQGLQNFSFLPLWQAYAAQFEPFEFIILPLALLGGYFSFSARLVPEKPQLQFYTCLLVGVVILNFMVFSLKSSSPFRPPYAFYIMPLSLLLAAHATETLHALLRERLSITQVRLVSAIAVIVPLVFTLLVLADFKNHANKTDWRGLSEFSRSNFSESDIVIFDSLSKSHSWKPYFYGMYRYPAGSTNLLRSKDLAAGAPGWRELKHRPVLVLFYYRDYRLFPTAKYVLMGKAKETPTINIMGMTGDTDLDVVSLNGLLTVSLARHRGGFLQDAYRLHEQVLPYIEETSAQVDHLLSLASLAAICDSDPEIFASYIDKARKLGEVKDAEYIEQMSSSISANHATATAGFCG